MKWNKYNMNLARIYVIFLVTLLFIFSLNLEISASEITTYLNLDVSVNPVFTISQDVLSIDFGTNIAAATTQMRELNLSCETNMNNPWSLSVYMNYPLSSNGFKIPSENFHWQIISSSGEGTLNSRSGNLTTAPYPFYYANENEWITYEPVDFKLLFYVDIPANQAAGTYGTSVFITMSDSAGKEIANAIVDINLVINPSLTISVSPSSIDFGQVYPGAQSAPVDLYLSFTSNIDNPWKVSLQATSELTSEIYTIPNTNFYWSYYKETGYGEETTYSVQTGYGEKTISTTPSMVYEAEPYEYITVEPVNIRLTLKVDVPKTQMFGTYTTTLIFTMTQ